MRDTSNADRSSVRGNGKLLIVSMFTAACLTRVFLLLLPEAGGAIAGIHVHHLMNGILLMTLGGIPAILVRSDTRWAKAPVVVFGLGLGLALDEWILLVVRETRPAEPYQSPMSLLGSFSLLILVTAYCLVIGWRLSRSRTEP